MKPHTVNKPNSMIQAGQKMTAMQSKIIFSMLSQFRYISSDDDCKNLEDTIYTIPFKDIIPNLSKLRGGRIYEQARYQAESLVGQTLSIKKEKKGKEKIEFYNLVSYSKVEEGCSYIEARFNKDIIPLLTQMVKEGYTPLIFKSVHELKGTYAIRIYELLERNRKTPVVKKKGFFEVSIDDLRFLLGMDKKKYPRWNNFRARVLEPAQKEIDEKTELRYQMEWIKDGRTITGVRFVSITVVDKIPLSLNSEITCEQTKREIQTSLFPKFETFTASNPLLESLQANSRKDIEEKHSEEYIKHYYKKVKLMEQKNRIESTFGDCLYAFLKNDKDEFYEIEKRKEADLLKQAQLKKEKEAAELKAKQEAEERAKKNEQKFKALEGLFETLDDLEKENYKKLVQQENEFIAKLGGDQFQRLIVEKFGKEKGLWNLA